MLYCSLTYLTNDTWSTVDLSNLFQCEIGEKSIVGFSFWQTEGGTAKLSCVLTPELRDVISQTVEKYFDAEFLIYESDVIYQQVFRGYLKRGEYEIEPMNPDDPLADTIITMTLHNALKVLIEMADDVKVFGDYYMPYNQPVPIQTFLPSTLQAMFGLLRNRKPALQLDGSRPLYTEPTVVNAYDPALATPIFANERLIWRESDCQHYEYPLTNSFDIDHTYLNIRQIKIEYVDDTTTYFHYYRNFARYFRANSQSSSYLFYQSIAKYTWKISGAGIYEIYGNSYVPVVVDLNVSGSTPVSAVDMTSQYPALIDPTPIVASAFDLGNNRILYLQSTSGIDTPNISLLYTGSMYYEFVNVNPQTRIFDAIKGMLRINMAALSQVGDNVIISNKAVDTRSYASSDNPVFEPVQIQSNEYTNDVVSKGDFPFVNAEQIADTLNEYFNKLSLSELPLSFDMEIDLNSLQDEITNTIEPGTAYQFGLYCVYITSVLTNYEERTAKIKGIGRLA